MIGDFVIAIEGLGSPEEIQKLKPEIRRAARMAINKTADRARKRSADEMRKQVNFPASYLRGEDSRLRVSRKASDESLEAIISGRKRATSLARFALGKQRRGVMVQVKPGRTRHLKNAFLMPLRSGGDGALGNLGLAVRTPRGQRPANAYKPVPIADGLWLLYGPSVDQVFKTVREDVSPDAATFLTQEFSRVLKVKF